ncbi:pelargonidin 3-O-(6-caffeoylglucoside) 5-O-(6-O-malonylglucoside) 4'''-malonyltransferase-like [Rutidosis leptorrhynchoides]|uniref:pelargonidin 3-O-(6-caffeoylglucoside) 5-O-(6-O-malonylglucoside) 4'''-malonyltransferase-like n=1 Tax=Rutidosis leptorrhynchoides TaxID=125765 RepID=UPI003A999F64
MAMKVEKQSSKLLKPFVPTPETHRYYMIGFTDEMIRETRNLTIVIFYPQSKKINSNFTVELEKSLEKTLTRFYPLAGRYVEDKNIIECNDEGVGFIHSKVSIKLQDFLDSEFDVNLVDEFIPLKTRHTFNNPLLTIQETTFECGGVAVGVNASHKIVDASTLCTFLNEWSAMNRKEDTHATELLDGTTFFNSSTLFPGRGFHRNPSTNISDDMLSKYTRMKFSFSESEISNIRTRAVASGKYSNCKWSKVQLVSAIIWNALLRVDRKKNNYPRESVLIQPVSLREKMATLIPNHSCGNLFTYSCTRSMNREITTQELADLLTVSVKKTLNDLSKVSPDSEEGQTLVINSILDVALNVDESNFVVVFTSWCKFPFYETDFGFGKPIWATCGSFPVINTTILMDDAGGKDVEAYVFLDKQDIPHFKEALNSDVLVR